MEGELTGHHWSVLRELLPIYRAIATVALGGGCTTSSWYDVWDGEDTLADRFPALLSHCRQDSQTVAQVRHLGLQNVLTARLSNVAREELEQITDLVETWTPTEAPDQRLSPFADASGKLHTSALYKMLCSSRNPKDPLATFVWCNRAPPRVQFFAWLLAREHLLKKHVLTSATCEVCGRLEETAAHIMFGCDFAVSFWESIRVVLPTPMTTDKLPLLKPPGHIPRKHFRTFLLLCCWQLWKRRNNAVFNQHLDHLGTVLRTAREEARTWSHRLPQGDLAVSFVLV